jgi:predicted ATPase
MLFSISGSQGQGKTTIINSLKQAKNYNVIVNSVSRGILKDWGYTLNEVNKYGPLTRNFQQEIMDRFIKHTEEAITSDEIYITERSYADIFSYAIFVLGPFNEYSKWLDEYYENCKYLQQRFSGIFYLTGRIYEPEDDGVRSVNKHYAKSVDINIKNYLAEFGGNYAVIDKISIEDRVNSISGFIESYRSTKNGN